MSVPSFTRLAAGALASVLLIALMDAQAQTRNPPRAAASTPSASPSFTNSALDAELFYQLLVGELNAISDLGGSPGNSFSLMLDAARKTNDAALYQRAVELAIQSRAGEPALQAARAWKHAQPQSGEANLQVLQVLLALNRLAETSEPLRTYIQFTPIAERAAAISQIPRLYARAPDKKAASALVEHVLAEFASHNQTSSASWTAIGRMRMAAEQMPSAVDAAARGQNADPKAIGPALLALDLMDPRQSAAEPIVRRYLQSPEALAEVRMAYARALLDAQRFAEAGVQVQRITREKPELAEAWLIQGMLELQENQIDKADASIKRYIELVAAQPATEEKQRGLTQGYLTLAQLAEKRGDFSLAESWLAKVDSSQALVSTQTRRASILAKQGKIEQARELIRSLPQRQGPDGAADRRTKVLAEVQLLQTHKEFQAAYDLLAKEVEASPQDHELVYQQATAAEKLKRYDEMERLMRRVIEIKPDFAHAYNALGYSFADRNVRLPEAKALLQKAIELAPSDPAITDSLGWVEFRLGNIKEAIKFLEKAYAMYPNAEIGAHLGEAYWANGQRDKAMSIWKESVLLDRDDEVLVETLKRFRVAL